MHACGHDVHTAVQLGVASVLASMRDQIPGTIKFIFQPAEEGPPPGEEGGADLMVREGALEGVVPSAIFGLHTFSSNGRGNAGLHAGSRAGRRRPLQDPDHRPAGARRAAAHERRPCRDGLAGRHRVSDHSVPQPVAARAERDYGRRHAGRRALQHHPMEMWLEGTVRTYNPDVRDAVERRMDEILDGITRAGGGSYVLDYDRGTPATINDRDLTAQMAPTLAKIVGEENVFVIDPTMGGEDFAYFANEVPGFFYRLVR